MVYISTTEVSAVTSSKCGETDTHLTSSSRLKVTRQLLNAEPALDTE